MLFCNFLVVNKSNPHTPSHGYSFKLLFLLSFHTTNMGRGQTTRKEGILCFVLILNNLCSTPKYSRAI